ncbi:MAG TPA: hydrolase [Candidatus Saccharimonadales bacterium]
MTAVNHLPKQDIANSPTGCCPKFDPTGWDNVTFAFKKKPFVKVATRSFIHMPLNMGAVFAKTQAKIQAAKAGMGDEYLVLSEEISPWKAYHFFAVSKEVPGMDIAYLTGDYYAQVFEGAFSNARKWHDSLVENVKAMGHRSDVQYFFYTTCPRCAKVYGKNYVVGLARLDG